MRLLVVRHAIAMDRGEYQASFTEDHLRNSTSEVINPPGTHDDDFRPLTLEGIRKMKKNAKDLRDRVKEPRLIVTSPLTRAMQTTDLLVKHAWDDVAVEECEALRPGSDPSEFTDWFKTRSELHPELIRKGTVVAIVGHEPHLSTLVSWLLAGSPTPFLTLKKGGSCLLKFDGAARKSRGELQALWRA